MERLDRLGWAAGFSFTSFGVRVGIRSTDPTVLSRLVDLLPPRWRGSRLRDVDLLYSFRVGGPGSRAGLRNFHLLWAESDQIARAGEFEALLPAFHRDLHLWIAAEARRLTFVHAGVVDIDGRLVLLPGRSFTGKSTLVAELVRRGALYFSDEYAVIDRQGRVYPYPRPLQIRSREEERPLQFTPSDLGGRTGTGWRRPAAVVFSRFRAGGVWRPRPLSTGRAALRLLSHAVGARRQPAEAVSSLAAACGSGTAVAGTRGDASEMASALEKWVRSLPVSESSASQPAFRQIAAPDAADVG